MTVTTHSTSKELYMNNDSITDINSNTTYYCNDTVTTTTTTTTKHNNNDNNEHNNNDNANDKTYLIVIH